MQNISVVGLGYVGLTLASVLANRGMRCIAVDKDDTKLNGIKERKMPFFEPSLAEITTSSIAKNTLLLTNDIEHAVNETDATFITVGTPSDIRGNTDLAQIKSVCTDLGKALNKKSAYHLVIVKSTVPPGTTNGLIKDCLEKESRKVAGVDFGLVTNPEFLREGAAVHDTINPHAIVIGSFDGKSADILESFYKEFHKDLVPPIIRTDPSTAEIIKYANNAFLATKVSFINGIATICQNIPGTDVQNVADAIGLDPRIGTLFLRAGPGYGGSCLPKDLDALVAFAEKKGYTPLLLKAVKETNNEQPSLVIKLAKRMLKKLEKKRIAVLGVAFKRDTDDIREAPSIRIIELLLHEGADVRAHDPMALERIKPIFGNEISYAKSALECITAADCCIVITDWDEYKSLEPEDFIKNMNEPVLIDARRVFDPIKFAKRLKFAAIGLGS